MSKLHNSVIPSVTAIYVCIYIWYLNVEEDVTFD